MSQPNVELTESEWSVIKAVWETEPCSAPVIHEKLFKPTGWHYSTVRTLMDRMVAKGVLKAKKAGKLTIYQSAVTRAQAAIDNQLRHDPMTKGTVVADKLWKLAVPPLLVYYSIDAPRMFVEVTAVRLIS